MTSRRRGGSAAASLDRALASPGAIRVAVLAAVGLLVVDAAVHLAGIPGVDPPTPERLLSVLVAAGCACVAALSVRRAPSVAWLASIGALTIATLDLAAFGRADRDLLGETAWRWLVLFVCFGGIAAATAAMAYAAAPGRRLHPWLTPIAVVVTVALVLLGVWIVATIEPVAPSPPDSVLGRLAVMTRVMVRIVALAVLLGLLGDLRPAFERTRARLAVEGPPAGMERVGMGLRILFDELAPGRSRAHRAAAAERTRLAADLHAEIVPAVRDALAESERGGSPERLAASLRALLAEIDDLVDERHSVVLEELGLVAAIERLAERIEDRSEVRVTIDVDGSSAGVGSGRPPREVERAAFRVTGLALENVVRHAPSATAHMTVAATPRDVALAIEDDGPGLPPPLTDAAASSGRRGLIDMRTAADAVGATLTVGPGTALGGTLVRFAWTRR